MTRERWVFGYGSLVWRPAFAYREMRPSFIEHFARRFWQGSTDHRGVPGAPGRVVTLVEARGERCFGMAYRLDEAGAEAVLAALDHREKGGYERRQVPLFDRRGAPLGEGLVYHATPDNPNYLGPAAPEAIAEQVLGSRGPSGENPEYVLRLAEALRAMGADDPHVFEVEAEIRARLIEA